MTVTNEEWAALGGSRYVSLGTYRRSGVIVPTPVWIAPLGDALVVTTGGSSGKAKRLRNDPRVRLRPCSRTGTVAAGALTVDAVGEIAGTPEEQPAATAALGRKYGVQFAAFRLVEGLVRKVRRSTPDGVILRITRTGADPLPGP